MLDAYSYHPSPSKQEAANEVYNEIIQKYNIKDNVELKKIVDEEIFVARKDQSYGSLTLWMMITKKEIINSIVSKLSCDQKQP